MNQLLFLYLIILLIIEVCLVKNKNNIENIIFVDFGYSKLNLILTQFKYNEFIIKKVKTD